MWVGLGVSHAGFRFDLSRVKQMACRVLVVHHSVVAIDVCGRAGGGWRTVLLVVVGVEGMFTFLFFFRFSLIDICVCLISPFAL